jgi:hypothetical protein
MYFQANLDPQKYHKQIIKTTSNHFHNIFSKVIHIRRNWRGESQVKAGLHEDLNFSSSPSILEHMLPWYSHPNRFKLRKDESNLITLMCDLQMQTTVHSCSGTAFNWSPLHTYIVPNLTPVTSKLQLLMQYYNEFATRRGYITATRTTHSLQECRNWTP